MDKILLEGNYLFRIIDAANEGIYVTDTERRFLVWNKAAERITGYLADEVLGRSCNDNLLCHTNVEGAGLCTEGCPLSRAMMTGIRQEPSLVYLRHRDGRQVPVEVRTAPVFDDHGQVVGGVELFQDVTERLHQEERLSRQKQELEAVLNNIREGILFLDWEGRITLHNRAMATMLGLPQEDLSGMTLSRLPDGHGVMQALMQSHRGFRGPSCWELRGCTEEKCECPSRRSLHCRCWAMRSRRENGARAGSCRDCLAYRNARVFLERPKELQINGKSLSVWSSFIDSPETGGFDEVIVFRDVTEEKVDAVAKCAAGTAHELRQPLQALTSALSLLEAEGQPGARGREYVGVIRESCRRLNDVIKNIGEINRYRTKHYSDRKHILDIGKSSARDGNPEDAATAAMPAAVRK